MRPPNSSNHVTSLLVREHVTITVFTVQIVSALAVLCLAIIVYVQRKSKAIGMWTILEAILTGEMVLFCSVLARGSEATQTRCLTYAWLREIGFITCYGAILSLLYRHLVEFRTRTAHRRVVKDTDLLKYLAVMLTGGVTYMAAFTALAFDLRAINGTLVETVQTVQGEQFQDCKRLRWDYVTEMAEVAILLFGVRLAHASRNARVPFYERNILCASVCVELAVSLTFYSAQAWVFPLLSPDTLLILRCLRTQASQTASLMMIVAPKLWYHRKQVRHLDYSCRLPLDAFKDQKRLSDIEIGEYSVADLSPDDVRTELKRLYLQLEVLRAKDVRRDNPHISKRRGGRKTQRRRFSLQKRNRERREAEAHEAEATRTPEDSICSNEGASAIYADVNQTV